MGSEGCLCAQGCRARRSWVFAVREQHVDSLQQDNLTVLQATAEQLDPDRRQLHLSDGSSLQYDKLCLCCGATPKVSLQGAAAPMLTLCLADC